MGEEQSLRQKTAKGLFWGGLSNSLQQLLGLLFGIVLARLLSRSDYGMIGMLTIFSTIANILQESGFISALVNRKNASDKDYNAVFWFNAAISLSLYLLLFLCAPLIADFYDLIYIALPVGSTDCRVLPYAGISPPFPTDFPKFFYR